MNLLGFWTKDKVDWWQNLQSRRSLSIVLQKFFFLLCTKVCECVRSCTTNNSSGVLGLQLGFLVRKRGILRRGIPREEKVTRKKRGKISLFWGKSCNSRFEVLFFLHFHIKENIVKASWRTRNPSQLVKKFLNAFNLSKFQFELKYTLN